eukprot:2678760-Amphidinium_carterae.1
MPTQGPICTEKKWQVHTESHNLDVCGDIDWTLYGNSDSKERCHKISIDAAQEVCDGERLQSLNHTGGQ